MSKLRKRNDRKGRYFVDYTDVDGYRYRIDTGTTDVKIANVWLKKVEERLSLAQVGQLEKVGQITVEDIRGSRRLEAHLRISQYKAIDQERCRHDLEYTPSTIELLR